MNNITSAYNDRDGTQVSLQLNWGHRRKKISEKVESCRCLTGENRIKITCNKPKTVCLSRSMMVCRLLRITKFISDGHFCRMIQNMSSYRQLFMLISVCVFILNVGLASSEEVLPYQDKLYINTFLSEFGNTEKLTISQFENLLVTLKNDQSCVKEDGHISAVASPEILALDSCNHSHPNTCLKPKCLNASGLIDLYSIQTENGINAIALQRLSPALLYQVHHCRDVDISPESKSGNQERPSSLSTWGYGFLFVSIINVCSLGGAIVLPFMKSSFYKHILMFMLGLAVGSLAGSGLLFLIPEAFHLTTEESHSDYIWKATTIMGGIYLFFLIEKFLKFLMEYKKRKRLRKSDLTRSAQRDIVATDPDYGICSVQMRTPSAVAESARMKDLDLSVHVEGHGVCTTGESSSSSRENSTISDDLTANGYSINGKHIKQNGGCSDVCKPETTDLKQKHEIATVAWMIIFGDGLHNFIDGLSIGAAFTESILTGVSVSIAVICEEVPHELGDFAILLNSGMSLKKALLYNFLSACMCYLGLIGGILLGQNTFAHDWIFALAGGMFLYISLVDMLPEMNSAAKEEERRTNSVCSWHVFMLQNAGLLIGYGALLLMAVFGEQIRFD